MIGGKITFATVPVEINKPTTLAETCKCLDVHVIPQGNIDASPIPTRVVEIQTTASCLVIVTTMMIKAAEVIIKSPNNIFEGVSTLARNTEARRISV